MVTNLGEFDTEGSYWYEPRGEKVTAEQEVDLGLTITIGSKNYKVIFANANLTTTSLAKNAYDFGDYFAWAATEPGVTYTYSNGSFSNITWKEGYDGEYKKDNAPYYNSLNSSYDKYTEENTLEAADDAANKILGGDWQIPTQEVWQALYNANTYSVYWGPNNGDKTLETVGDIKGMKITKSDDTNTYLFLPAAGYVYWTFSKFDKEAHYWSGTLFTSTHANCLDFYNGSVYANKYQNNPRYQGYTVRPVRLVAE